MFKRCLFCLILLISAFKSQAIECQVNLTYGIIVDPTHIRFTDKYRTFAQINHDKQLFIRGREIELDDAQQKALTNYAKELRNRIPQIVSLVSGGVEIRLQALDKIIGGLTGENSRSHQKIQETFADIQERLWRRFNHSSDSYYIAPQDFNEFDRFFEGALAKQMEQVVSNSLGSIFTAFDQQTDNTDNLEQRMVAFGKQLDIVSEDMEIVSLSNSKELSDKANEFCETITSINLLELELNSTVAQLSDFNLIQVNE